MKQRLESKLHFKLERVCVALQASSSGPKRANEMELTGTDLMTTKYTVWGGEPSAKAEEAFELRENSGREDGRRFVSVLLYGIQYYRWYKYIDFQSKDHRGKSVKVDLIATFLASDVV